MGVPEFSSSLTDFNQAQLDAIEQATQDVLAAVNVIKNTDISLLNTKIGVNTAAAGTASVFARLAQIAGFTDTLETLLGLTGAAAGTGSVFARLAQISNMVNGLKVGRYLSANLPTVASVINTWYTIVDVSGTGAFYAAYVYASAGIQFIDTRLTLDGVETVTASNTARTRDTNTKYDLRANVSFLSSLKLEIKITSGPANISGAVDYGLV